jgi:hypothetical protein
LILSGVGRRYVIVQMIFFTLALIGSVAAGVIVESQASQERDSALILTRKDAELQAQAATRSNRGFLRFLLSTPAALAVGVLANYLFLLLTRLFAL